MDLAVYRVAGCTYFGNEVGFSAFAENDAIYLGMGAKTHQADLSKSGKLVANGGYMFTHNGWRNAVGRSR